MQRVLAVVVAVLLVAVTLAAPVTNSEDGSIVPGLPASGIWNTDIAGTYTVVSLPSEKERSVTTDDESMMSLQPRDPNSNVGSRLLHSALHIDASSPPPPHADKIQRSHEVPLFPTRYEEHSVSVAASSEDGRNEMKPTLDEPLDEDCDSPQIGEVEVVPQGTVSVNMNTEPTANVVLPEQDVSHREVLDTEVFVAQGTQHIDTPANDPTMEVLPIDSTTGATQLPEPSKEVTLKSKCSRNSNGNDVPDALGELGDDCGMPEPEIPCETPGNSTRCEPRLVLRPPTLPPAEKMPAVPAGPYVRPPNRMTVHVELTDFGSSVSVTLPGDSSVMAAVLAAGAKAGVRDWHVSVIRNAGADVPADRILGYLEDSMELIVYLKCVARSAADALIVALPICEDLHVIDLEVRVEVPASDDVFVVSTTASASVNDVLSLTPLGHASVDKITYNGARILADQSLSGLHFANKSALVVYLTPSLAPAPVPISIWNPPTQLLTSPSPSPALPNSNIIPVIGSSSPSPTQSPSPNTPQLGSASPSPQPSNVNAIPIPEIVNDPWPRAEMTKPAFVKLRINDGLMGDLPVVVQSDDLGGVMFDVLKDSTGKAEKFFSIVFHRLRIDVSTPLKSFGFVDGDVIPVQMLL